MARAEPLRSGRKGQTVAIEERPLAAGNGAAAPDDGAVTVVTQTRVAPASYDAFAQWQQRISDVVAAFPGLEDHRVIPPRPPEQVDWVILQRFASTADALAWLRSDDRQRLLAEAQPMLVGRDDGHLVRADRSGPAESVSVIVSTRIVPGQEAAFRTWEQRIAATQARAPGFQGYRLEPPIPDVQEDWVAILRFDTDAHLQGWLGSPERRALLAEANRFTAESHVRTVRTGFDQWFRMDGAGSAPPEAWKQNMLVLLALYPVVFLFGALVQGPLLQARAGLPFWLALFVGNAVSVLILSQLVPLVSDRFGWWLRQPGGDRPRIDAAGAALVAALYLAWLLVFARWS
ncbi:MAG: antibiotic biosynthesis monooxygenase [Thermomicrobiales bacterium]|nr:antibiotic biosynthesis monooxygenase [Thermomicrobiales bacterium]